MLNKAALLLMEVKLEVNHQTFLQNVLAASLKVMKTEDEEHRVLSSPSLWHHIARNRDIL